MATREELNPDHSFIPEDIIYNILLGLPVKALLRFTSVCKSWLSIISSRDFIKTHLSISTNDPYFNHHRLFLVDIIFSYWEYAHCMFRSCSVCSLNEPVDETVVEDYRDLAVVSVVGYCNGLICLRNWDDHFLLWNLSTRKSRLVPKLDIFWPEYGFGYDELNDDFKVFAISGCCGYEPSAFEQKVSVYSLKSDCWRMIGDFPFPFKQLVSSGAKFANGAIYWFFKRDTNSVKEHIVSCVIKTETFREISQPNYGEGVYICTLGTFNKNLSVVCQFEHTRADLWVMKECGVEEYSWTKLFTILYMDRIRRSNSIIKPICTFVNGDIMLRIDSYIVLYNPKNNTFKDLYRLGNSNDVVITYVESLVSL